MLTFGVLGTVSVDFGVESVAPGVVGTAVGTLDVGGSALVGAVLCGAGMLAVVGMIGAADVAAVVGLAGADTAPLDTVEVTAVEEPPPSESPASVTSAAVSAPSASTITLPSTMIGARQLGDAASRVRAAAPHCKHHS